MAAKRGLSEENMKLIMGKMSAQTRINLSRCSKDVSAADKCVPMMLESLTLKDLEFTVNDSKTYALSTFNTIEKKRNGIILQEASECIRLTVSNPDGIEKVENVLQNRSIQEAMSYLILKIFGGRDDYVSVKTLRIYLSGLQPFPEDLKFRVQKLEIYDADTTDTFTFLPIIHPSSFPLQSIRTDAKVNIGMPIFKQSEELEILAPTRSGCFKGLTNKRVVFAKADLTPEFFNEIRLNLRVAELGTCYFFKLDLEESKAAAFLFIYFINAKRLQGEKEDLSLQPTAILPLVLALTRTTQIKIYFRSEPEKHGIYLLVQPMTEEFSEHELNFV